MGDGIRLEIDHRALKELHKAPREVQVRFWGSWRAIYVYRKKGHIVVLKVFVKKSFRTPRKEIKTALGRLSDYP